MKLADVKYRQLSTSARRRSQVPLLVALMLASTLACGRSSSATPTPIPTAPSQESYSDYYPDNPMVHQVGQTIVGLDGKPIKLRGVNLGGWLLWEGWEYGKGATVPEAAMLEKLTNVVGAEETAAFQEQVYANYITEKDIERIAQLGFNSVRIPVNAKLLEEPSTPYTYKEEGWAILDRTLDWCERYGVFAIVDLHAVPGGQSRLTPSDPGPVDQLIWRSEENRKRTVALWSAIASRYRDRRIIAAFDLINEPLPPRGQEQMLTALETAIVAAIRQADPYHMVVIEGAKFSSDFGMFARPISGNQAYGFHMYTWFGDNRAKGFAYLRALSDAHRVPLWAGEFGENKYEMIASTVDMFEDPVNEVNGGWSFWTWKKVPVRNPALMAIQPPADWTAVINWIGNPRRNPQPSREQALSGMAGFIEAIRLENTQLDTRMLQALMGRLREP